MDEDAPELISLCDACKSPIAPGEGHLWVDNAAVSAHQRAAREWRERQDPSPGGGISFDITELADYPPPVRWNLHHDACDPEPDAGSYVIDVERLSSWGDLMHWTAHLMGKPWLTATDWSNLLEGVADGAGPRLRPVVPSKVHP